MFVFKLIFVILICAPISYMCLRLNDDLIGIINTALRREKEEREERMRAGEKLTREERVMARRALKGRKVRR